MNMGKIKKLIALILSLCIVLGSLSITNVSVTIFGIQ